MIEQSKNNSDVPPSVTEGNTGSVPPSERGKEEHMSFEEREPSVVFGLVGLSYLAFIAVILGIIILYWVL